MNVQINQLVKTLLQKESLDLCSVQELEEYADRHPYFGAAQLLLAKKLQAEDQERYVTQLQKTLLFFHNPLWVEKLLDDSGDAEIIRAKTETTEPVPGPETSVPVEPVPPVPGNLEPMPEPIQEQVIETEPAAGADVDEPSKESAPAPFTEEKTTDPLPGIQEIKPAPAADELLFQPYHTVDYFASQGINFKPEDKPADKLGQQLKSFTDWLKAMKKLPAAEINRHLGTATEYQVEELAGVSIEDREVVTETMAEVWEKQGNTQKAIDIYRKLSLLDPPKSSYFAAKIAELQKLN